MGGVHAPVHHRCATCVCVYVSHTHSGQININDLRASCLFLCRHAAYKVLRTNRCVWILTDGRSYDACTCVRVSVWGVHICARVMGRQCFIGCNLLCIIWRAGHQVAHIGHTLNAKRYLRASRNGMRNTASSHETRVCRHATLAPDAGEVCD